MGRDETFVDRQKREYVSSVSGTRLGSALSFYSDLMPSEKLGTGSCEEIGQQ